MTAPAEERSGRPTSEWIVCRGVQRDVRDGGVACPLTGAATALEACLECHHLAWATGERDRPYACEVAAIS